MFLFFPSWEDSISSSWATTTIGGNIHKSIIYGKSVFESFDWLALQDQPYTIFCVYAKFSLHTKKVNLWFCLVAIRWCSSDFSEYLCVRAICVYVVHMLNVTDDAPNSIQNHIINANNWIRSERQMESSLPMYSVFNIQCSLYRFHTNIHRCKKDPSAKQKYPKTDNKKRSYYVAHDL